MGNLHKWGCAPRGTAFMYVASAAHRLIVEPPIVSHGFGTGFASSMVWAGAKDYSEFLALPALIRGWWRAEDAPGTLQDPAGAHQDAPRMAATAAAPDTARRSGSLAENVNYQRRLLSEAVTMLSDAWGTAPLVPASEGLNMSLVRLPPLDPRTVLRYASGDSNSRSSSSSSGTTTTTAAAPAAVSADNTTSASCSLIFAATGLSNAHGQGRTGCSPLWPCHRVPGEDGRRPALRTHLGRRVQ